MNDHMIPYIAFEAEQARNERHIRRLWIALIITIILIALTNAIWIYEWTRYDYVTTEYSQDGEGINNINTGTQEDIINGTATGNPYSQEEKWEVQRDEDET